MRIHAETTIGRPIDEVFAFISDPRNDPAWCGHVKTVAQVEGEGPAVSARYLAMHDPRPGKPVELEMEIVEFDPPARMVVREEDFAAVIRVTYELEEPAPGLTRLAQTSELTNKGLWKLMLPISYVGVRTTLPKQFRALKAQVEGEPDAVGGR